MYLCQYSSLFPRFPRRHSPTPHGITAALVPITADLLRLLRFSRPRHTALYSAYDYQTVHDKRKVFGGRLLNICRCIRRTLRCHRHCAVVNHVACGRKREFVMATFGWNGIICRYLTEGLIRGGEQSEMMGNNSYR